MSGLRRRVVAIVGPTAIGKSAVGLRLAQLMGGEIVSADSRQVYRFMDIGTAKPSAEERALVPHHLIDLVDPDQEFTLSHFKDAAQEAMEGIFRRGRLPVIVGGTGLYVRVLLEGLHVPAVPPDPAYRRELEERARAAGHDALHRELALVDPAAAARIHPRNVRRVIRALEVWRQTGRPFSAQQGKAAPPFDVLKVGLTCHRDLLYQKIDRRVDAMMAAGLLQEVEGLAARGYAWDLPAMSGIGYRQLGQYLRGEIDLRDAVERIKFETHRYARQQYTWFRLDDAGIRWFYVIHNHVQTAETLARELRQA